MLPVLFAAAAPAQYVSLNNTELDRLKEFIGQNADVKQLYLSFRYSTDQALNANPNPIDTISTEGRLKGDPIDYVTGEKTHEELVHSTVRFDSLRAANHEAGYQAGTLWDLLFGLTTLALAAYFDHQYSDIYKKVRKSDRAWPYWQLVLNKVME